MNITSKELEEQKAKVNSLIDDYFALSKKDEKKKEELISVIRKEQDEVDRIYRKLKGAIS